MGLMALTGALSGAGTAAKEAIGEQQKMALTRALEESRQSAENMRQDKLIAAQKEMQGAQLGSQATLQGQQITSHEKVAGEQIASQEKLAGDRVNMELALSQDRIMESGRVSDNEIAERQREFNAKLPLEQRKLKVEEGKIMPMPTADGKVALFSPTGQFMNYASGADGKPLQFKTDVTEGTKARVTAYIAQQTDISRELRNPLLSQEEKASLHKDQQELTKKIEEATGYTHAPVVAPKLPPLNLGKYGAAPAAIPPVVAGVPAARTPKIPGVITVPSPNDATLEEMRRRSSEYQADQ